jgi:hypothetical protein
MVIPHATSLYIPSELATNQNIASTVELTAFHVTHRFAANHMQIAGM